MRNIFLTIILFTTPVTSSMASVLEERIDWYDPMSGAYTGSEIIHFAPDGRRLRWETYDVTNKPTLQFFVTHDEQGRESGAWYIESGSESPTQERFTYEEGDNVRLVTYYHEPGVPGEKTRIELDAEGRELRKQYYRADGAQYGEEDVLWNGKGRALGWDFRYTRRKGGASFRYRYLAEDSAGQWLQRLRLKNDEPERLEVRTLATEGDVSPLLTPAVFSAGAISSVESETSPSFTHDGHTMVFARYADEWESKQGFIAEWEDNGWKVSPLPGLGSIYNLAISPDGESIFYSVRDGDERRLFRTRKSASGWSQPVDFSGTYGLTGTYPCLTADGRLLVYDAEGSEGPGIYSTKLSQPGSTQALFTPPEGNPFDAFASHSSGAMLLTQCFDDRCESDGRNGIWEVKLEDTGRVSARHLSRLPYGWGAQAVPALGLLVFTDGEDILAVPLHASGVERAVFQVEAGDPSG